MAVDNVALSRALRSYHQADEDGVMVLVCRQACDEGADQIDKLRRQLETHAVRSMGPRSPFWQCIYCSAMQQTPLLFKHAPECILFCDDPAQS